MSEAAPQQLHNFTFVYSTLFREQANGVLSQSDYADFESTLTTNPNAGDPIVGGKELKKIRVAIGNVGKSGGGRAIFLSLKNETNKTTFFFVVFFPKSSKANISKAELKIYASLVKIIKTNFG